MRITHSVDGVKRANLRITSRLGGDDFANILCLKYHDHYGEEDGPLPALSRVKILDAVQGQLKLNADARHWWRDAFDEEEQSRADELWEWADALVRLRFPEFY